ncbi:MAG TPA: hypothetical protein VFP72_14380 [Kineosporiaceae bacterium]|nr:hypothetical protein [Kineosporiaceae bacterium]
MPDRAATARKIPPSARVGLLSFEYSYLWVDRTAGDVRLSVYVPADEQTRLAIDLLTAEGRSASAGGGEIAGEGVRPTRPRSASAPTGRRRPPAR